VSRSSWCVQNSWSRALTQAQAVQILGREFLRSLFDFFDCAHGRKLSDSLKRFKRGPTPAIAQRSCAGRWQINEVKLLVREWRCHQQGQASSRVSAPRIFLKWLTMGSNRPHGSARLVTKCLSQRAQRSLGVGASGRNHVSLRAVAGFDFQRHRRRTMFLQERVDGLDDPGWLLIWHETSRALARAHAAQSSCCLRPGNRS